MPCFLPFFFIFFLLKKKHSSDFFSSLLIISHNKFMMQVHNYEKLAVIGLILCLNHWIPPIPNLDKKCI